jgi:hypothetical protein
MPLAREDLLEPVPVAPTSDAESASVAGEEAPPGAAVPEPPPVAEPPRWIAQARFEIDPARTVARGATPRGPQIGLAARLERGEADVREIADARAERTEPTSEENR